MRKIECLYAVINDDPVHDEEGLVCFAMNNLPMVVANTEEHLDDFRNAAQLTAKMGRRNVKLVKFTNVEVIERF